MRDRPLPRSGPRRRLAMLVAAVALVFVISSGTLAFGVADKGPGRELVNFVNDRIGPNDELHFAVHTVLGHVFALCPCTDGLSRLEYSKAAHHRPKPER